uniref:Uncharacterized protein n=1 Tax=Oryza punctata TaxID=4537 RepID=A0A0E0JDJ5_ORYPU
MPPWTNEFMKGATTIMFRIGSPVLQSDAMSTIGGIEVHHKHQYTKYKKPGRAKH